MRKLLLWILLVMVSIPAGAATSGLPFIQDDFPKASAQAAQRNLPLFVECWAPW